MPIAFRCSNASCGKMIKVKEELAGKRIKCPSCGEALRVPGAAKSAVEAGPAATKAPAGSPATPAGPASSRPPARRSAATPLEKRWEKSPLLNEKAIVARQKSWVRKQGPDYNLLVPGSKDNVGECNVRPRLLDTILGLFNLHGFLPKWFEVSDAKGPLFWMKVVKMVHNRYDLYDPTRKELLASVKTIFSTEVALRLLDAGGKDSGEVVTANLAGVGNQSYFGFDVLAGDERKMGDVTNEANDYFRRTGKRAFSGGKGYVGTVAAEFADDPKAKVLVLAVTIAARMEDVGVNQFDPMKA